MLLGMNPFDLAFEYIEDRADQRVLDHFLGCRTAELRSRLGAFGWSFV